MRLEDRPRPIDNSHCEMAVINKNATPMFGYYPIKTEVVECDWEYNPMIGMIECNRCGMTST